MARLPNRTALLRLARISAVTLAGLVVLILLFAPREVRRVAGDLAPGRGTISIATAGEQGAYYLYGLSMSEVLAREGNYTLEVLPTAGSVDNLDRLSGGRADFGLIQGGLAADIDTVSVIAVLGRQYAHLVVPADSAIRTFRDLAGKRVGVGPKDSGFEALGKEVFAFFDFAEAPTLVHDHQRSLAKAFLEDQIDAAFTVYSLFAPAIEDLLASGWYRLVPIPEADAVTRYLPGVHAETLPPNLYGPDRAMPKDFFPTLAVDTLLVARRDTPGRAVTAVLEAVHGAEFLRDGRFEEAPPRERLAAAHMPVHPAAEAYYGRDDPVSSDRFEIASFFLAGMIGLVSLTQYLLGHIEQRAARRQRDAIRPYFRKLLEFGNQIEASQEPEELTPLIHDMMAVQREAERAWLGGTLGTEDMENLYAVYGIRSGNAFRKMQNLLLRAVRPEAGKADDREPEVDVMEEKALEMETPEEREAVPEEREDPATKQRENPAVETVNAPLEAPEVARPVAAPPRADLRGVLQAAQDVVEKPEKNPDQLRLF